MNWSSATTGSCSRAATSLASFGSFGLRGFLADVAPSPDSRFAFFFDAGASDSPSRQGAAPPPEPLRARPSASSSVAPLRIIAFWSLNSVASRTPSSTSFFNSRSRSICSLVSDAGLAATTGDAATAGLFFFRLRTTMGARSPQSFLSATETWPQRSPRRFMTSLFLSPFATSSPSSSMALRTSSRFSFEKYMYPDCLAWNVSTRSSSFAASSPSFLRF
mmetsp:Transcript_7994/g.26175  ORF Transcript_7994/g.26175 Transcript_7994/m.26175 type:complete len:219 (+) Transcript_7994:998-1654(+)